MADAQPLDDATLEALEKALEGMTPGPWRGDDCDGDVWVETTAESPVTDSIAQEVRTPEDARGIALLRNHASALLHSAREAARLRTLMDQVLKELDVYVRQHHCGGIESLGPGHSTRQLYDSVRAALQGEKTDDSR
jgi:hypothetical protein